MRSVVSVLLEIEACGGNAGLQLAHPCFAPVLEHPTAACARPLIRTVVAGTPSGWAIFLLRMPWAAIFSMAEISSAERTAFADSRHMRLWGMDFVSWISVVSVRNVRTSAVLSHLSDGASNSARNDDFHVDFGLPLLLTPVIEQVNWKVKARRASETDPKHSEVG